jgi:hypothetical protein
MYYFFLKAPPVVSVLISFLPTFFFNILVGITYSSVPIGNENTFTAGCVLIFVAFTFYFLDTPFFGNLLL